MTGTDTLAVLYRDERIVVVDKPSGLLVHRSPIDRHETRFALQLVRDQLGRRVHPVHRLDKGTSGALVLALDPEAAAVLSQAFATREVAKTYVALVRGWPAATGTIDRPLTAVVDERSGPQSLEPREATTTYRRLAAYEIPVRVDRYPSSRYALVELSPHTGRRHQLRRHLAGASHPIVGDSTYGKGAHNRLFAAQFGVRRLLLACTRLVFPTVPGHAGPLQIEAPLAPEFAALIGMLAANYPAT
ncbi:MAG TPA: pseudouridine synthase [Steroidobacteraceae bacterium]|nr:pseudouridine synthase [Steroidobacteraceae bacterium]